MQAAANRAGLRMLFLRRRLERSAVGSGRRNGSRKFGTVPAEDGAEMVRLLVTILVGVTADGEKLQLAPAGRPEQLSFTCWLKPFSGVIVSPICPEAPGANVSVDCPI